MGDRNRVAMKATRAETPGGSIADLLERIVKRSNPLLQREGNRRKSQTW
jgi:hypothetical protein